MKSHNAIVPLLATGLLVGACSTENANTASPDDTQLINAIASCKLLTTSVETSPTKQDNFPRVHVEVATTKSVQTDTNKIHYGNLVGHLLRYGVAKPLSELSFGWQRNPDGSESQTSAYEVPNLDLFTETFNDREPLKHEIIAIYDTVQNDSHTQSKNSQRYCGEIVIGQAVSGGMYANIVQPLTPPAAVELENGWGLGDTHCQIVC